MVGFKGNVVKHKNSLVKRIKKSPLRFASFGVAFALVGTYLLIISSAASSTVNFSGRLTAKNSTASHTIASQATGPLTATLTYSKLKSASIEIYDPNGTVVAAKTGPSPISITGLNINSGNYNAKVIGSGSGTYKLSITYPVLEDSSNPAVAITNPSEAQYVSGTITVSGTASDNVLVSKIEVAIDTGAYTQASGTTNWSYPLSTTSLTKGGHDIRVRATDSSGNVTEAYRGFFVDNSDTAVPSVSISSPANGATVSGQISITGTASDNISVSKVEVQIDSQAFQPATGTANWTYGVDTTSFTPGSHSINAKATDSSGNIKTVTSTFNIASVDTTKPTVTISSPTAGATISGTFNVTGTASDNVQVSKVEIAVDGGTYSNASGMTSWSNALNTTLFANGAHTIFARVTDSSGNINTTSVAVTISNTAVVDTTAPTGYISNPTTSSVIKGNYVVTGSASDNISVQNVDLKIDGGVYIAVNITPNQNVYWSYSLDTTKLTDGAHKIEMRVTDKSGNVYNYPAVDFYVANSTTDTIAPVVSVSRPVQYWSVSGYTHITGYASDASGIAKVELTAIDSAPVSTNAAFIDGTTSWSTFYDVSRLSNGLHQLTFTATDQKGNKGSTTIRVNVANYTSDTQAPQTPGPVTVLGTTEKFISLRWNNTTDNVGVARYIVYVNGLAFRYQVAATSFTLGGCSPDTCITAGKSYQVSIAAVDFAGNTSAQSTLVTANTLADTKPPYLNVMYPVNGQTVSGKFTLGVNAYDLETMHATTTYQIDGGTVNNSLTAIDTWTLSNGAHILSVVAQDGYGNKTTATVNFNVSNSSTSDTVKPIIGISSPLNGETRVSNGANVFTGAVSDNQQLDSVEVNVSGTAYWLAATVQNGKWYYSLDLNGYAPGVYTINVRATDGSKNISTYSVQINVVSPTAVSETWTSPEGAKFVINSSYGMTAARAYDYFKQCAAQPGDFAKIAKYLTVNIDDVSGAAAGSGAGGGTNYTLNSLSISIGFRPGKGAYNSLSVYCHEYGHVWTIYHLYQNHNGDKSVFERYRWSAPDGSLKIFDDPRLGQTYGWDTLEILGEDYKVLLSSPIFYSGSAMTNDIVAPAKQPGLKDWYLNTWRGPN